MNLKRQIGRLLAASLIAGALSVVCIPVAAADAGRVNLGKDQLYFPAQAASAGVLVRSDNDAPDVYMTPSANQQIQIDQTGTVTLDGIVPSQTFYLCLGPNTFPASVNSGDYQSITAQNTVAYPADLGDPTLFQLTVEKQGGGKKLVQSVSQISDKVYYKSPLGVRSSYLQVILGDSDSPSRLRAGVTITFEALKNASALTGSGLGTFRQGDTLTMNLNLSMIDAAGSISENNGDRVYYDPDPATDNIITWAEKRAALQFGDPSDAKKFYARLSTKSDLAVYIRYGDPVNADFWFYDFVGSPDLPSGTMLTLGIPWELGANTPNPADCFLYRKNPDGSLTDVTSLFFYSEEGISGWSAKVRKLDTYLLSNTKLIV